MKEHIFGQVKVMEDGNAALIRVPSMICNVEEAEKLMCELIDGITKAREIIKDEI